MRVSQGWLDADSLQQTSECRDVHVECAPVLGDDYPSVLRRIKDHRWRDQYGYVGFSRVVLVERFEASGATLDPARRIFAASGIALLLVDDLALDGRLARALTARGRSIRLIRAAPPAYEFVHDQMNAYLAACWFVSRPTITVMQDLLSTTKAWQDGGEAQRTLWGFVAAMLDRQQVEALWIFAGDDDRRAVLGRALAERAEQEGWPLTRPAVTAPAPAA